MISSNNKVRGEALISERGRGLHHGVWFVFARPIAALDLDGAMSNLEFLV